MADENNANATEIEITEDMIGEGVRALLSLVPEDLAFQLSQPSEVAELVYRKMAEKNHSV